MKKTLITLMFSSLIAATGIFVQSTAASAADEAAAIDIAVQYRYRRSGSNEFKTLSKGNTLYSGDSYKIVFTPTETTYVYLFQKGSSGNLYRLFPMISFNGVRVDNFNPAQAGTTYYIPAANKSFLLDEQIGDETLYFIAAREADTLLEQQYEQVIIARRGYRSATTLPAAQAGLEKNLLMRDPGGIGDDDTVIKDPEADEESAADQKIWQRLEICQGCVNILTFRHR